MVRQVVATTFLRSAVWHAYSQCRCPPVFCKDKNVDHKSIRSYDTRVAPPILTCAVGHHAKRKLSHARGMLGFERRRKSDAISEIFTP